MKLAVTAKGPDLESPVDERLGRAYWLMIFDLTTGSWQSIDNSDNRNAASGAGKATAEALIELGVQLVITGEAGPKAFRMLHAAGIKLFYLENGSVREAIDAWQSGHLQQAPAPNETGNPFCLMSNIANAYHPPGPRPVLATGTRG